MNEKLAKLLKEPSTWAGIAALVVAAFSLDALTPEQISVFIAGAAAIFLPEAGK